MMRAALSILGLLFAVTVYATPNPTSAPTFSPIGCGPGVAQQAEPHPQHALYLTQSPTAPDELRKQLELAGIKLEVTVARDAAEFKAAYQTQPWDLVFGDRLETLKQFKRVKTATILLSPSEEGTMKAIRQNIVEVVSTREWRYLRRAVERAFRITLRRQWRTSPAAIALDNMFSATNSVPAFRKAQIINESVYVNVNSAFLKMIGRTEEQVLGKTSEEVWPEAPALVQDMNVNESDVLMGSPDRETGAAAALERIPCADGKTHGFLVTRLSFGNAGRKSDIIGLILENALSDLDPIFAHVVQVSQTPLISVDFTVPRDKHPALITHWNPAATALLGMTEKMAAGRDIVDVLSGSNETIRLKLSLAIAETRLDNKPKFHEVTLLATDGRQIPARITLQADLDSNSMAVHIQDLTQVDELKRRAEGQDGLGLMAARLTHDLKNPLAPLLNSVQLLRQMLQNATLTEIQRNHLHKTLQMQERNIKAMSDMIEKLRLFSKGERGDKEPFLILDALRDAVSDTSTAHQGVKFVSEIPNEEWEVFGDRLEIWRALQNVINNAVDANGKKGMVNITAALVDIKPVEKAARPGGKYIRIGIRQEGPGMSPEVLADIERGIQVTTKGKTGTGLGMKAVSAALEDTGGFRNFVIHIPGFEVVLNFPLYDANAPAISSAAPTPPPAENILSPKGNLVAMVDDNRDAVESLQMVIEMMKPVVGAEYQVFYGAPELRTLIAERGQELRVIFLDLNLPKSEPYELLTFIRSHCPQAKIIMLTGRNETDIPVDLKPLYHGFLVKPAAGQDAVALMKKLWD